MRLYVKKEGRKGQFTAFVILGIVLLVIVGITLLIMSMVVANDLERQGKNAVKDYLDQKSINYYVYTCIDTAVQDVLEKYSLQGGVIFDYQGGAYLTSEYTEGEAYMPFNYTFNAKLPATFFNVTYGIMNSSLCPPVQMGPPEYPFEKTKFADINIKYESEQICSRQFFARSGALGFNNYTRLCYPGSINSVPRGNTFSQCLNNVVLSPNRSAEYILQVEIAKRIERCINFSYFELTENHNITVTGPPNTTIVFNDETFSVRLEYPFSVKLKSRDPVLVKHTFDYSSKLRLTKLSKFMVNILEKESKDIYFDIGRDFLIVPGFDPGTMKLTIYNVSACVEGDPNYMKCRYENDSVVIVQDKSSRIGNHSLTFISAIKNRRPVLDYIHETNPSQIFDIIVAENGVIRLEPLGKDPDDKPVTYNYLGWKETFDEEFICDFPLVPPQTLESCIRVRAPPVYVIDHNWTTSEEFRNTGRIATYKTNRTDIGPHNVTIQVIDESGLEDFQILRILVFDMPHINIVYPPIYPDIPPGNVSIEDPYRIDATGTTPSQYGGNSIITQYTWEDSWIDSVPLREFVLSTPSTQPSINVPADIDSTWNFFNIHTKPVIHPSSSDLLITEHKVKVTVEQYSPIIGGTATSEETLPLDVHTCVPHRNPADPEPYPYSLNANYFEADHACCLGSEADPTSYRLANSLITCAIRDIFGEYHYLTRTEPNAYAQESALSEYRTLVPAPSPLFTIINDISQRFQNNDVYRLNMERKCDGVRGNLCAGPIDASLSMVATCADWTTPGQSERCEGPEFEQSANTFMCKQYNPGQSYESEYEQRYDNTIASIDKNGICNENQLPSRIGANGYDIGGTQRLLCKATCSAGGCTFTRSQDCVCNPSVSLECTGQNTASWQGNLCKFGCLDPSNSGVTLQPGQEALACTYGSTRLLPCTNPGTGNLTSCMNTNPADNPTFPDGYCYYDVNCLPNQFRYSLGQRCQSGQTDSVTNGGVTTFYCMHGAPLNSFGTCSTSGQCSLSRTQRPAQACAVAGGWQCTETGWRCGNPAP